MTEAVHRSDQQALVPIGDPRNIERAVRGLKDLMWNENGEIRRALKAHIPSESEQKRFCAKAVGQFLKNPDLFGCTRASFYATVGKCAELKLHPCGEHGVWLVPRGRQLCADPDYRALMDMARRGGEVSVFEADVVYSGEEYWREGGTNSGIHHKPNDFTRSGMEKDIVGAYAIATLKNGHKVTRAMSKAQIKEVQKNSKAGDRGPWVTHWEAMAIKTVLKAVCKLLPRTTEFGAALDLDKALYESSVSPAIELDPLGSLQVPEPERVVEAVERPQRPVEPVEAPRRPRRRRASRNEPSAPPEPPARPLARQREEIEPLGQVLESVQRQLEPEAPAEEEKSSIEKLKSQIVDLVAACNEAGYKDMRVTALIDDYSPDGLRREIERLKAKLRGGA